MLTNYRQFDLECFLSAEALVLLLAGISIVRILQLLREGWKRPRWYIPLKVGVYTVGLVMAITVGYLAGFVFNDLYK